MIAGRSPGEIGVHHDHHAIAHGIAHCRHQRDVLGQRRKRRPKLDGLESLLQVSQRILGTLLGRGCNDGARVCLHPRVAIAPQPMQGLSRRLADDVAERHVKEERPGLPHHLGVLRQRVHVLADELRRHHVTIRDPALRVANAPAGQPLVRLHLHNHRPTRILHAPRRPPRMHIRIRMRHINLANGDIGNLHSRPLTRSKPRPKIVAVSRPMAKRGRVSLDTHMFC